MWLLIAASALVIALLTAAFIAPQVGNARSLRIDPCALEGGGWGAVDPNCAGVQKRTRSLTKRTSVAGRTNRVLNLSGTITVPYKMDIAAVFLARLFTPPDR